MKHLTKLFKALGNEKRLLILKLLLAGKQMTVGDISDQINLSFKSTSKHLYILHQAGFILPQRTRNHVFYSIAEINDPFKRDLLTIIDKFHI